MLERFEDEIGQAIDFRQCGYLIILSRPEDLAIFRRNVQLQHSLGVMTEWLDGDEIRKRLPMDLKAPWGKKAGFLLQALDEQDG